VLAQPPLTLPCDPVQELGPFLPIQIIVTLVCHNSLLACLATSNVPISGKDLAVLRGWTPEEGAGISLKYQCHFMWIVLDLDQMYIAKSWALTSMCC
jgi:hypothetical protein